MTATKSGDAGTRPPMRVIHLTVLRHLASGQRKQLRQEAIAARALEGVEWTTVAVHDGEPASPFESQTPRMYRAQPLRFIHSWLLARRLSKECDVLLMRHSPFDVPGVLLSRSVRNRVSVHHSREVDELPLIRPGLLGRVLAGVEQLAGASIIRQAAGVLGVTREIASYETQRARCPDKARDIYPNTVVTRDVAAIGDSRAPGRVEAAFICAQFTAWHGLDLLLDTADAVESLEAPKLRIHLIGNLDPTLRQRVESGPAGLFEIHGHLTEGRYREVVSSCDVGIGSLALHRQNMAEGSTLKMCEMLAMGLPVYTGAPDVVLPAEFAYCRVDRTPSLAALAEFGAAMKDVSRNEVRTAASPFVEKEVWMRHTVSFLRTLVCRPISGPNESDPAPGSHHAAD